MSAILTVREAIDRLYEVFAKYPLPAYTDPCLHCHTIDDEAKLHSKHLRLLQWQDVSDYACDSLLVWGNEDTFKHLLPRIFELLFFSDDPEVDYLAPEIVFSKFRHGKWRGWPADEQVVVEQLLNAVWRSALRDPFQESGMYDIDTWLCCIGQAEDDLSPYLQEWLDNDNLDATLALSHMTVDPNRFSAFWDGRESQFRQLKLWIASSETTKKIDDVEDRFEHAHDTAH